MLLDHDLLIKIIGKMGYPINEGGMCFGFAVMGMQAFLAGDLTYF